MATIRRRKKDEPLVYGGPRNDLAWKFRNGTHFLARTDSLGYIESVAGVVSPLVDGTYVGCCPNRFGSYSTFPELEQAKLHVTAIVALEGDKHDEIS
jgi:hypothetical protein